MRKMEQYAEAVASALAGNQEGYDKVGQAIYDGVVNLFNAYPPVR